MYCIREFLLSFLESLNQELDTLNIILLALVEKFIPLVKKISIRISKFLRPLKRIFVEQFMKIS